MLTALEGGSDQGQDAISELVDDAVALLRTIPQLWLAHTTTAYEDRLPAIIAVFARKLSAHEHGVLSGELTYSLSSSEAEQPAAQMRLSLAELAGRDHGGIGDLISVQTAAIALAALLLRAAGNIATDALASEAPERRTSALNQHLRGVEREIVSHAEARRRNLDDGYDPVGHYLGRTLRVAMPPTSPDALADTANLVGIREAWLHVAAFEHIAISTLNRNLATPTYQPRYKTLGRSAHRGQRNGPLRCASARTTRRLPSRASMAGADYGPQPCRGVVRQRDSRRLRRVLARAGYDPHASRAGGSGDRGDRSLPRDRRKDQQRASRQPGGLTIGTPAAKRSVKTTHQQSGLDGCASCNNRSG